MLQLAKVVEQDKDILAVNKSLNGTDIKFLFFTKFEKKPKDPNADVIITIKLLELTCHGETVC